tara:strand:- start:4616 stop:4945 length:330 start_codon:yes stop_codon:yes gene_type:complete
LQKNFKSLKYEPDVIEYIQPQKTRKYNPDFKIEKNVYIEAKGKLDISTRQKMVWFKESNPDVRIIFLFMNPSNKINKRSKTTYGDWSTKVGFEWLDFRKDWLKELKEIL